MTTIREYIDLWTPKGKLNDVNYKGENKVGGRLQPTKVTKVERKGCPMSAKSEAFTFDMIEVCVSLGARCNVE